MASNTIQTASNPEIKTTSIETPSSPEELTTKDFQDALNTTAASIKDCPPKIQHRLSLR